MSALEERRQRAREAFDDRWSVTGGADISGTATWANRLQQAREEAIETATRVRITPEIITAARAGWLVAATEHASWTEEPGPREYGRLKAAFEAAGFEVEQ